MSDRVSTRIEGPLAYVTMTRADKLNGLDLEMLESLITAAKQVRKNREVRAVILSGEGTTFSAGLDFGAVAKQQSKFIRNFFRPPWRSTNLYQEVCWVWRRLPVPVIAAIHGHCFGGGLQIALGADFRFATPDSKFSIMESKWGLVPDMSGTVTLRELLPMDVLKRLAMTGEVFDGTKAHELGLVTELSADPMAAAEELAAQIATRSPDAIATTKLLFQKTWNISSWRAFRNESHRQLRLMFGANHKVARNANAAKEDPQFKPRVISR